MESGRVHSRVLAPSPPWIVASAFFAHEGIGYIEENRDQAWAEIYAPIEET